LQKSKTGLFIFRLQASSPAAMCTARLKVTALRLRRCVTVQLSDISISTRRRSPGRDGRGRTEFPRNLSPFECLLRL